MQLKQAILQTEKQAVAKFLNEFDLSYRQDTEYTAYIEKDKEIAGTVSLSGNLIMQLAVCKRYQGENIAVTLIDHAIKKLRESGVYGYKVFTKPQYMPLFENMGFRLLVGTDKFVALEGGISNIKKTVNKLVNKVVMELGSIESDTGAIVINGNPFTQGHMELCEHVLKNHKRLLLFVLEEDLSEFSFKERFSLAFVAMRPYHDKVSVLPSTEYIVSKNTFPDYFLHGADETTRVYAEYDALIFKNYFMPALGISKRYFGSETSNYMKLYNQTCLEVLGKSAQVVERFAQDGKILSAKSVRALIDNGQTEEALKMLPLSCRAIMRLILGSKK